MGPAEHLPTVLRDFATGEYAACLFEAMNISFLTRYPGLFHDLSKSESLLS